MNNDALDRLDIRFPYKRAVVTGGASGLGYATASLLARRGWKLALLDRDAARLADSVRSLAALGAADVSPHEVDTGDEIAVQAAVDQFASRYEGLDLAGSTPSLPSRAAFSRRRRQTGSGSCGSTCSASPTAAGPNCPTCWQAAAG